MRKLFYVVAHCLVFALGAYGAWTASRQLRSHWLDLLAHLSSGDWEVRSDRKSLENRLRLKYADEPRKWAFHFAAGTPYSLTLGAARGETLQNIGTWVLKDTPQLDNSITPLWSAYADMLAAAVQELAAATALPANDSGILLNIAHALMERQRPEDVHADLERANTILAKLPRTDRLRNALDSYRRYEREIMGLRAFPVATDPEFDLEDSWERSAITLEQESRCRATIRPTVGAIGAAEANISIFPRLVEVQLVRPWLSDAFLDSYERHSGVVSERFFGKKSDGLRLIPARIWVLLGEEVEVEASDSASSDLDSWFRSNICCVATCGDASLSLRPAPVFRVRKGTYHLRRADATPLLYAIISRRREPA